MYNLNKELEELHIKNQPIKVGLIGAGLMGSGMVSQVSSMKGMEIVLLADRTLAKARQTFIDANISEDKIIMARTSEEADKYIDEGYYIICDDFNIVTSSSEIDAVVDATGNVEAGAEIALNTINNGKHIILLNVETDCVVGPILKKLADEKEVVYTGSAGDEPGAIMELYDFADALGFDIKAVGKGKNNPVNYGATPDSVREVADKKGVAPRMIASFQEGTNTMIELALVSNATGLIPDRKGGHGISATLEELPEIFSLKDEGGILDNYGIVDYVNGIAPGVFAIVSHDSQSVMDTMKYVSMGDGPNYVLYRPFHLTSLETPLSIAMAVLENKATIAPLNGPVAEVITVAKTDLKAGDYMDGYGMYTCYGEMVTYDEYKELRGVPIGLVNEKTKILKDIKKGEIITEDMVEIDKTSKLYELRQLQEKTFDK